MNDSLTVSSLCVTDLICSQSVELNVRPTSVRFRVALPSPCTRVNIEFIQAEVEQDISIRLPNRQSAANVPTKKLLVFRIDPSGACNGSEVSQFGQLQASINVDEPLEWTILA